MANLVFTINPTVETQPSIATPAAPTLVSSNPTQIVVTLPSDPATTLATITNRALCLIPLASYTGNEQDPDHWSANGGVFSALHDEGETVTFTGTFDGSYAVVCEMRDTTKNPRLDSLWSDDVLVVVSSESGGGGPDPDPPGEATPGTQATMGLFTFTANSAFDNVGVDGAGKAWAVLSSGTRTVSVSPAPATVGGNRTGEVMKNPVATTSTVSPQGLDQDASTGWNASLAQSQPVTVGAGDILLVTKRDSAYASSDREGMFEETGALHILSQTPPTNALLHSSVGWSGRGTPGWAVADINGWYTSRTTYATPSGMPPFSVLMDSLDKAYLTWALGYRASGDQGYENFSPRSFGGGASKHNNYGRYMGRMLAIAAVALVTNTYTEAQTKEIAWRVAQFGMEVFQPFEGLGNGLNRGDGGHYQQTFFPACFMLYVTGQTAKLNDAWTYAAGNFAQCFEITAAVISNDLSPHDSGSLPNFSRRRTLGAQPGGSTLRIPGVSTDNAQMYIPAGAIAKRDGGAEQATVASAVRMASGGATRDIPLTGTSPFSSGHVVYFEGPESWMLGKFDWSKNGYRENNWEDYSPAKDNSYRGLQAWGPQIAALDLMGALPANAAPAKGYAIRASAANTPSAANDFPGVAEDWQALNGSFYSGAVNFMPTWLATL